MRKKIQNVLLILCCVLSSVALSEEKLPSAEREWLENVSPIITKKEKEVFLGLKTDQERKKFIRFFWRQRDPLPDTADNEFYTEYMERIRFADQNFGIGSFKRGSQTERGLFYLLLGKPLERQTFATASEVWPLELWFYKGEPQFGLPDYFYLVFYQPQGFGEYKLYYPGAEGPEKLVIPSMSTRTLTRESAVAIIKKVNAELSRASLSYLPGDQAFGLQSFSSEGIIAAVRNLPEKKFSDAYARSFGSFKTYVETDYSHSFIGAGSKVKLFRMAGQPFMHWSIEPDKMSFAERGGFYAASFELIIRMEDLKGRLVLERSEEIPLRLTPEEYQKHERRRFAFQDILPVIAGEYKFFFMLKNKTAKEFTSLEARISVPGEADEPWLSPLLLFHSRDDVPVGQKESLQAFTFDGIRYMINAKNEFSPQESLGAFIQIRRLKQAYPDAQAFLGFEILSLDNNISVRNQKMPLADSRDDAGGAVVFGPFPLTEFKPGYYQVETFLVSQGRKRLSEKENFILLAQPYSLWPWVLAKVHGAFPTAEHLRLIGSQFFLTQNYEKAGNFFERSLKLKDDSSIRLLLGKSLYALNRFRDSLAVTVSLFESSGDREAAKVMALNYVGLQEWALALATANKLLAGATEVGVLNLAAECHIHLGQPEKALPLLQKSLSLDAAQPSIKDMEKKVQESLEKKH